MKKLFVFLALLTLTVSCASQSKIDNSNPLIENNIMNTENYAELLKAISPSDVVDGRDYWNSSSNDKESIYDSSRREGKL